MNIIEYRSLFKKIKSNLIQLLKKKKNKSRKLPLFLYIFSLFTLSIFAYLSTPLFFNYDNYQRNIEKKIYEELNLRITINGKIKYSFLPTPNLIVQDVHIIDLFGKKEKIGLIKKLKIKTSFKGLSNIEDINLSTFTIIDPEINIKLNNYSKYYNFFEKYSSKPLQLINGKINFFDKEKFLFSFENTNINYLSNKNLDEVEFIGNFLGKELNILFQNKKRQTKPFKIITTKMKNQNFMSRVRIFRDKDKNNNYDGETLISFKNQKLDFDFLYKDSKILINNGTMISSVLRGDFLGYFQFAPFSIFDLDINVKSLNAKRIFEALHRIEPKNNQLYTTIIKKINGVINLNIDKIYSKNKLIESIESNIVLSNGDFLFNRLIFDLGKYGASDLTGEINNKKKYKIFKFQKNIFIDNESKFYNKLRIQNVKNNEPVEIFFSGKLNLDNFYLTIDEISKNKNLLNNEEKQFVIDNFIEIMMQDRYEGLLNFEKLKEFLKVILT